MKKLALLLSFASLNALAGPPQKADLPPLSLPKNLLKGSLESKIRAKVPLALLDYLLWDNQKNGWPNVPKAVELSPGFKSDLEAAIRELPVDVKRKVNEKLVGIFVVSDLGGSAYTDRIIDEKAQAFAGFVVIDATVMDRTANAWATWKENSPFRPDERSKLEATVENPGHDTRANAIQYILLHEFGHILNIGSPLLPDWGKNPKDLEILSSMRFFDLTWKVEDDRFTTKYDGSWDLRKKIHYYTTPEHQLDMASAIAAYKKLPSTNFPTLYAVTNPGDDFAESFVNYVHVVRMKKPWRVSLSTAGETLTVGDCWQESRCREKRKLIEEVLSK